MSSASGGLRAPLGPLTHWRHHQSPDPSPTYHVVPNYATAVNYNSISTNDVMLIKCFPKFGLSWGNVTPGVNQATIMIKYNVIFLLVFQYKLKHFMIAYTFDFLVFTMNGKRYQYLWFIYQNVSNS
jgi:hypothetical protein